MFFQALSLATTNPLSNSQEDKIAEVSVESVLPTKNYYQIFGTLKNKNNKKPDWVYEIFEVTFKKRSKNLI